MTEKIKISPKTVRNQIEELGMTRVQLSEHYGISAAQINKFLAMTNMDKLRAKKAIQFEIDMDDEGKNEDNSFGICTPQLDNLPTQEQTYHHIGMQDIQNRNY